METLSEEARRRLEALKFWGKHGLEATQDFYELNGGHTLSSRREVSKVAPRFKLNGILVAKEDLNR